MGLVRVSRKGSPSVPGSSMDTINISELLFD